VTGENKHCAFSLMAKSNSNSMRAETSRNVTPEPPSIDAENNC